jgi:hypothetical protein
MIFSIYRKLRRDFHFLEENGFEYLYKLSHYVKPSIMYKRQLIKIHVGFDYEINKIYLYIYNPKCTDILEKEIGLEKLSYKEQIKLCLSKLKNYI